MNKTMQLIDALENAGYEWRSYSGRFMYGKSCVGATLSSSSDLWELAQALYSVDVRAPDTDSMGRGIIAYWPDCEYTEELELEEIEKELDERT